MGIERWPYEFDEALLAFFFIGLGFFYRIFETDIHKIFAVSYKNLLISAVLFFTITILDRVYIGTSETVFRQSEFHNFLPSICYAVLGVFMMILFIKLIPSFKPLNFIGANSLVYYYLNGGVIKTLKIVYDKIGLHFSESLQPYLVYVEILFMAISTSLLITALVLLIKKYCPIITGNKAAFNNVSKKFGWNITF